MTDPLKTANENALYWRKLALELEDKVAEYSERVSRLNQLNSVYLTALEKIKSFDKNPFLHADDPRECAICVARDVLDIQPTWVSRQEPTQDPYKGFEHCYGPAKVSQQVRAKVTHVVTLGGEYQEREVTEPACPHSPPGMDPPADPSKCADCADDR